MSLSNVSRGVLLTLTALATGFWSGCMSNKQMTADRSDGPRTLTPRTPTVDVNERLEQYATVRLTTDLSALSDQEQRMIPLLIDAAEQMNECFWMQAYGNKNELLDSIQDPSLRRYVQINYGPWDRLHGNEPFVSGFGPKPLGANLYPQDMTREAFTASVDSNPDRKKTLTGLYTVIRRDSDSLMAIPYHRFFGEHIERAAEKLTAAADLTEDPGLRLYLKLRAEALLTDDYRASDFAWLNMKNNTVDIVIGPIETYEDQLFGYKASYEAYVLVKDRDWSEQLSKYATLLPGLQHDLPVPDVYKQETPGTDSDLNAYDVIYYAGDCNAGSKTIAINLPNDEEVQLRKGTRRLQLKNAMRAKYDQILVPIAEILIAEDQRQHITFDAFFGNTMFHEVAHGLGIKNTINDRGSVRQALRDQASAIEEGKADILGLYMVTKLFELGALTAGDVRDNYVTFLAGIFRSVRFGASSAHGRANMLRFNYFQKMGAFSRDPETGTYRADFDKMKEAMESLARELLVLQGDGDYERVRTLMEEMGGVDLRLRADLDRLTSANIPVDIIFEQGLSVLNN